MATVFVFASLAVLQAFFWAGYAMGRRRDSRRRGGYLPPGAYTNTSPETGTSVTTRTRVGFSSYDPPGSLLADAASPRAHHLRNSFTAPSLFGDATADRGESGLTRPEPADCGEAA